jgi:transcription initiation factor TFIID subunit TAF12
VQQEWVVGGRPKGPRDLHLTITATVEGAAPGAAEEQINAQQQQVQQEEQQQQQEKQQQGAGSSAREPAGVYICASFFWCLN